MVKITTNKFNRPEFKFIPDEEFNAETFETKKASGVVSLEKKLRQSNKEFDN